MLLIFKYKNYRNATVLNDRQKDNTPIVNRQQQFLLLHFHQLEKSTIGKSTISFFSWFF